MPYFALQKFEPNHSKRGHKNWTIISDRLHADDQLLKISVVESFGSHSDHPDDFVRNLILDLHSEDPHVQAFKVNAEESLKIKPKQIRPIRGTLTRNMLYEITAINSVTKSL